MSERDSAGRFEANSGRNVEIRGVLSELAESRLGATNGLKDRTVIPP
jgi:hypothetical protein